MTTPGPTTTTPVQIETGPALGTAMAGDLGLPAHPFGVVVFAHGSGSSRNSPRNRQVAGALRAAGLATLLFDLLTPEEAADRANVFDIPLLAARMPGNGSNGPRARPVRTSEVGTDRHPFVGQTIPRIVCCPPSYIEGWRVLLDQVGDGLGYAIHPEAA